MLVVSLHLLVDHVSAFYFSEKHVLQYGKLMIVNRRKPARKGHEDIFQCPTQGKERLGTAHMMLQRIPLEVKRKDLTTHLLVKGGPWIMQTTQKPNSIFLFNEYKFIFIIKKEQCKITTSLLRPGLLCCYRHCCLLHNFMTLILSTKLILFIVLFVMPLNVIF